MPVRNVDSLPAEAVTAGRSTKRQVLIGPDEGPNFAMRRFIMEPGGGMPMHTNEVEHEQYVLRGSARIRIGDETHHVKAGDVVYIPGGVPHSYDADEGGSPSSSYASCPTGPIRSSWSIAEGRGLQPNSTPPPAASAASSALSAASSSTAESFIVLS